MPSLFSARLNLLAGCVAALLSSSTTLQAQKPDPVKGHNVKLVIYGEKDKIKGALLDPGAPNGYWVGRNDDAAEVYRVESRDEWSVFLIKVGGNQDIALQLDLYTRKIRLYHLFRNERLGDLYNIQHAGK